jgi:hypothetical protein
MEARKELAMRPEGRRGILTGLAAAAALVVAFGCSDSNSVTGPDVGSPSANIAGAWVGTFRPDSAACTGSSASASFQQNGSRITGQFSTASCGPTGVVRGTLSGNLLTGAIAMAGCTGGAVSGTVSESSLSLTIGDLRKPLVTGDQIVMPGGTVSLTR